MNHFELVDCVGIPVKHTVNSEIILFDNSHKIHNIKCIRLSLSCIVNKIFCREYFLFCIRKRIDSYAVFSEAHCRIPEGIGCTRAEKNRIQRVFSLLKKSVDSSVVSGISITCQQALNSEKANSKYKDKSNYFNNFFSFHFDSSMFFLKVYR